MSPPEELPTAYKLVHACCLPLRGRSGHVPALQRGLFGENDPFTLEHPRQHEGAEQGIDKVAADREQQM